MKKPKKKTGRPPLAEDSLRVGLVISRTQWEKICRIAKLEKVSCSEVIRNAVAAY